jgi:hypothetical protein
MQKARGQAPRRQAAVNRPPTACKRTVSGTISLPAQGCFSPFPHGTSSLSVASEYLALGDGPPGFPRDFTCPAVLGNCFQRDRSVSSTGLSPSAVVHSRSLRLHFDLITLRVAPEAAPQPRTYRYDRFGLFPVRSPLLRESLLISLPGGTEMFHFPPLAFGTYGFSAEWCRITDTGLPHSEIFGSQPA